MIKCKEVNDEIIGANGRTAILYHASFSVILYKPRTIIGSSEQCANI